MSNKIEFSGLKKQYNLIKNEIETVIKKILDRGEFVGGKEVEDFEKEMAEFCGIKYAVGVNSGTDALFLSLRALGIKAGDEVITTPFTFIATAEVIANLGARPVFVDIDPETFNIDCSKTEKAITKKTKAIIPVHLFGQMAEMDKIMQIAKKYKLYVIEDAAQAIGAKYNFQFSISNFQRNSKSKNSKPETKWRMAGTVGDLGCFSFFPSKNLGGYGDGGMVVTNNKELANKVRLLRNHGSSPKDKYLNLILGTNSRLDAIQAAVLRIKLRHLSQWIKKRRAVAKYYSYKLKEIRGVKIPGTAKDKNHSFNYYIIRAKNRNGLKKFLIKRGVPTAIYYPVPLHLQPAFRYLGYKKDDFPEAEKAAKEVLSLSVYPELSKEDQNYIVKKIKEFYGK